MDESHAPFLRRFRRRHQLANRGEDGCNRLIVITDTPFDGFEFTCKALVCRQYPA